MANDDTKKKSRKKYFICLAIILVATTISVISSLWGQVDAVMSSLASAKVGWVLVMMFILLVVYYIEALVIKIFARLYTNKYSVGSGFATVLTGQFYSDITPGASGGQVMQAYTLRNQGIPVSAAASIFVMSFILYQVALISFDVLALIIEKDIILSVGSVKITEAITIPMWPIILFGFLINLAVTGAIYLLSYSKVFHHFVLYTCINFLGKIKLIKNPEKSRENLRVSVENYKIELKRLHSNIPVTITIVTLYFIYLLVRYSLPYFAGLALGAFGDAPFSVSKMINASFLGAFHQMVTGLLPLPGSAGVSEYFFQVLFYNFYGATYDSAGNVIRSASANVASAQILWRSMSFYLMFLVSGIFVAIYPNKPKEEFATANRKTFVTLQISTLDERRLSSDTMYETRKMSRRDINNRLSSKSKSLHERIETRKEAAAERRAKEAAKRAERKKKEPNISADDDWESIDINI